MVVAAAGLGIAEAAVRISDPEGSLRGGYRKAEPACGSVGEPIDSSTVPG